MESINQYCARLNGAEPSFPFGEQALVYKVKGKIFAILNLDHEKISLKCGPEYAEELRERHPGIVPGYHLDKKHWNTIDCNDDTLTIKLLESLVDLSYDLIVKSLPKRVQAELKA